MRFVDEAVIFVQAGDGGNARRHLPVEALGRVEARADGGSAEGELGKLTKEPTLEGVDSASPVLRALGWMGSNLKIPMPFNPAIVPYAVLYWFMDNSKARRDLGVTFRPAREVLVPTLEWINEYFLHKK